MADVRGDLGADGDRIVDLTDEGPLLPDQTSDDADPGWGESVSRSTDEWLLDERPPHWE